MDKEKSEICGFIITDRKGFCDSINQEQYLRVFLEDPELSMENRPCGACNTPFTLGRKNWVMMGTIKKCESQCC